MLNFRINRPTYWCSILLSTLLLTLFAYLGKLSGGLELMMVVIGIPRLHDIGRSGWIIAGIIFAEFAIFVVFMIAGASPGTLEVVLTFLVLSIAALAVWLGTIPGQSNANRWGEAPQPGVHFGKLRRQS